MPVLADYFYHSNKRVDHRNPLLYLHDTGRSEADGADFLARLSSGRLGLFIRAPYPKRRGYTFIRQAEDRSLDSTEIENDVETFAVFLKKLPRMDALVNKQPILIGYGSGAIMASATLWQYPHLIAGAILLRPQLPSFEKPVRQNGLPVLLLPGLRDSQRDPDTASELAYRLTEAGAKVTYQPIDATHEEASDRSDLIQVRSWLDRHFPSD